MPVEKEPPAEGTRVRWLHSGEVTYITRRLPPDEINTTWRVCLHGLQAQIEWDEVPSSLEVL